MLTVLPALAADDPVAVPRGETTLRPSLNAVPQASPTVPADSSERAARADARSTPERIDASSARRRAGRSATRLLRIVTICVAVAALRLGRELLVPIVLAVLITLMLSGIVEALRRFHRLADPVEGHERHEG